MGTILFFGDIVGRAGCERFAQRVHALRRRYSADAVIVNGENSAEGNGVTPASADMLLHAGADVITGGNHSVRRPEIYEYMERQPRLLRPANLHESAPGQGIYLLDNPRFPLAVVNLMGLAFMDAARENPFDCMERMLKTISCKNILIDFHGEATSEKRALGFFLDGKVSALVGTHTHVPTADEQILPKGTGYITDAGMCGGAQSVIGVKPEQAIRKQRTGLPARFCADGNQILLQGVAITLNKEGKCERIERFSD